jgi:hypothetical protein
MTARTTAAVGESTSHSARHAGREAAGLALRGLGRPPTFLLLFATTGYDQVELIAGVTDVAGGTPSSGCSGEGVISQRGADEGAHAVVVMAVASDSATFVPLLATGLANDPRRCAVSLAEQIRYRTDGRGRCLILLPDGISGNCASLIEALEESLPYPLVIVGGAAGADMSSKSTTYQYHRGRVVNDAVAAVLIGGDVAVDTAVSHGSTPIGMVRTVTRSEGGTVHEIDGRPAWDVFREYLDGDPTDMAIEDSLYLGFGERLPPELVGPYGEYIMRAPLSLDRETGAIFFPGGLRQGSKIRVARRDPDRMREGAAEVARELASRRKGMQASLVLQFDCVGRGREIFGDATAATVSSMQDALGREVPWLGCYTFGEIAPLNGKTLYHNQTVVLCALYDGDEPAVPGAQWTSRS